MISLAGVLAGSTLGLFLGLSLLPTPEDIQADPPARHNWLNPGEPGFAAHLENGCPGDVSWSPCALELLIQQHESPPEPETFTLNGFTCEVALNLTAITCTKTP